MKKFFNYLTKKRLEISKPFIEGSILDIGCGPAMTYDFIKPKIYAGFERNKEYVKKLKEKLPFAQFYARDIEKDKFNINKKFDTIVLFAVIEHIKNPELLFKEIKSHLNKNGRLIITTPTPFGNFIHALLSYIGLTSKEAVEEHCNIYSYKKFVDLGKKHNFKIIKYKQFELRCNSLIVLGEK